uniref:Uncharacterized protein n=1 Tax=Lactuca sativa TaxID=4236 RepID=A0A9R1WIS1_LACSA|nr:hypothetical protein LSAT_V11C100034220 [Lactuca sativa]
MTLSGIPPWQILSSLRQKNQNLPTVSRTIYNLKAKIRKDNLNNRSMVSALFEEFEKEGFVYDYLHNPLGHITHFVFKKTLENREPSVIMSDRELALMNVIKMNVLANCKKHFSNTEEFDIFMSNWNNIAYLTTFFEQN